MFHPATMMKKNYVISVKQNILLLMDTLTLFSDRPEISKKNVISFRMVTVLQSTTNPF